MPFVNDAGEMIRMCCPSIERVVGFDQLYPQLGSVDVCMDARFSV